MTRIIGAVGASRLITATSDSADAGPGAVLIMAVLVAANSANIDVQLNNATTDTSADELVFHVLDGDTQLYDFTGFGGVYFGTGLTFDIQGAGGQVTVFAG